MRDLSPHELKERFGDRWEHIDWDASGDALTHTLTDELGTRCKVRFEPYGDGPDHIYTRIDTREFGSDPAGLKVNEIFESFTWVQFDDYPGR